MRPIAGHVASADMFWNQPEVLDGDSELFNFALATQEDFAEDPNPPKVTQKEKRPKRASV